ncbi:MAG TPA: D,D-dipeptide ABC transporter permease, partial [Methylomirabilota bacterium]|nr:D,D-dipeptide ABC transporter permease [Methylomirabilota bacterium]
MTTSGWPEVLQQWRGWLLAETPASRAQARLGQAYVAWLGFRRNPLAMAGLTILIALILVALVAPWLTDRSPFAQDLRARLRPPSAQHWFGTDELGRDIYTRVLYGSRITLVIVGLVVVMVAPAGLLIGTAAGYLGGWVDTALMRVTDVFLAFPRL